MKSQTETIKKIIAVALSLAMCLCMMVGCGSSANNTTSQQETAAPTEAAAEETAPEDTAETEPTEEPAEETAVTVEDLEPDADGNITIVDMAGREVTFKANPTIWNSSPTAEGWLCAIVPEQLAGWAAEFTEDALAYYPESVRDLETIGGNYGTSTANEENILVISPDVIINTYDCSESGLNATVASADEMAEEYGIPRRLPEPRHRGFSRMCRQYRPVVRQRPARL